MRQKTSDILTSCEWDVATSIAEGRTVKESAQHLTKSLRTVVNQIQSVYDKVNIPHNLNALATWYICRKNGIELPEFMRRAGAFVLLSIFMTTLFDVHDIYRREERLRTRRGVIEIKNE